MVDMGGTGGGGGSAQQYCLKWNNHQNNLLRVFLRLLGQEQFTDVTVASEGRRIKCHKVVLSACSSYFEQLFMSYNEPNQIIILKDTPYQDISAIIEFMYKGEINVSQDRLSSLLKTAENLKVKGLAEVSGNEDRKVGSKVTNNNVSNSNGAASSVLQPGRQPHPHLAPATRLVGPPPMQMMGRPLGGSFSDGLVNGDIKRKRGRPRTLDGPEDIAFSAPRIASIQGGIASLNPLLLGSSPSPSPGVTTTSSSSSRGEGTESPMKQARLIGSQVPGAQSMSPLQAALNRPTNENSNGSSSSSKTDPNSPKQDNEASNPSSSTPASPAPSTSTTPVIKKEKVDEDDVEEGGGGEGESTSAPSTSNDKEKEKSSGSKEEAAPAPLSPEVIASWGIIKLSKYLVGGTRQQYWEEIFVKNVMEAVRVKQLDMKGAAEMLGVSYGTLYGRYRENFGYLKHAWNTQGRPIKRTNLWTDPGTSHILDAMRSGTMSMKQAAEALGMEPAMLAYHLAAKVDPVPAGHPTVFSDEEIGEEELDDDEDGAGIIIVGEEEPDGEVSELMEIQPEIIVSDPRSTGGSNRKQVEQYANMIEEDDGD